MTPRYPQDSSAEEWPTGMWPGNYAPPSDGAEYVLTPAERADKVREALYDIEGFERRTQTRAIDLLPPGAVILTAAEREQIRQAICGGDRVVPGTISQEQAEALALLSGVPE